MKFNYQARTKEGESQMGIVEASTKEAALTLLQKYGLYVTYLEESRAPLFAKEVKLFQRISLRDIVLFSRQLSIMFGSKVHLVEALRSLASQTANSEFRETIFNLSEEVEGGNSFSKALARHPKVFSPFYIAIVKSGEAAGKMANSLDYLAEHLEREYHLKSKTQGALIYPALVITVAIAVIILMIIVVVPKLEEVIKESEAEVPAVTKMVFGLSAFLTHYAIYIVLAIPVLAYLIYRYRKSEEGKIFFDSFFLKIPIVGPLLKTIYLSQFAENLSTLIAGGLMISQALELTGDIIDNSVYKKAIFSVRDEVRKGVPISSVLALYPEIFSPMFVQMTAVGEKTGGLDTSLMQIATFYQREVERSIDNVLSILEPMLIIILGVVIGGLMLSVLLPLYSTINM